MRGMALIMAMGLVAGSETTSVSFVLDTKGGVIVPVSVGALQDLKFLLDTGSTRSVVSETVAQRLALQPVARSEVVTAAGSSMSLVVALPATCLAAACHDEVLAIMSSKNALDLGSGKLDGILGADVLGRGDFTLDYKRRRFEWGGGADAQRSQDRLTSSVEDGRTIVVAPQGAGEPLRLVADSGADAFVFFDSQRVRALSTLAGVNRLSLQTLGGAVRAESMLFPRLRVGAATWMDEVAAVVPRPSGYPQTIDGLMPLRRFASVSFRRAGSEVVIRHR